MPAPLSLDLRQRIVNAALARTASQPAIAERFQASRTLVEKLLRQHRATGDLAPRRAPGGTRLLSHDDDLRIASLVTEDLDATLPELAQRFHDETGRTISPATVSRSLTRTQRTRNERRSEPPSSSATT